MIQMARDTQDPLRRAAILSDSQMQLAWALRAAIAECQEAGHSWATIGEAMRVPKETLFRQYAAGPVVTAKAVQSKNSPGATEMHRSAAEAVYAFQSQNGTWFGPADVLGPGEFTDGTLHFEPTQPGTPFAGQVLTMRFGHWEQDVSVHACQLVLPDGQPRRVRVTHVVLDFLFGDGQTPLRQAMTALAHAAAMNPRVPAQLGAAIDQASFKMGFGIPVEEFIATVEAVVALSSFTVADEHVAMAMRRLERVVREYRTWARVATS